MSDQANPSLSEPVQPTVSVSPEPAASDIPASAEFMAALPDLSKIYFYGDPQAERDRLMAQTFLFSEYIRQNAHRLINNDVSSILDIGCGQGQLTLVLSKLYPKARIVGIDFDAAAIAAAQRDQRNAPMVSGKIEYVVGDIQDKLPDGPFDLIFGSAILLHLQQPEKVLQMAFEALRPGGSIWIKELSSTAIVFDHPLWPRIFDLSGATFKKMGRDLSIGPKVEGMLNKLGFTDVSVLPEVYKMSNKTTKERIALSNALAATYNSGVVVSKVLNFPHEEFLAMHRELSANTETLTGRFSLINLIGRRPGPAKKSQTQAVAALETASPEPKIAALAPAAAVEPTPPEVAPLVAAVPTPPAVPIPLADALPRQAVETQATEPTVDVPESTEEYFFTDTGSDRDRLIAQAFLLSEYTRQNATRLIRNDVRTILDMGCGEGQLTIVLSKVYPKAKIIGIDRDAKAIEMAQQNQRQTPLVSGNVEFMVGDIEENLPDGPFDLIFTSLVMVHQPHVEKILRAAYSRLVPNGAIWIKDLHDWTKTFDDPAWHKFYALSAEALRKVGLDPEMGQHLEALMDKIGFTNIQTALEPYRANNDTWQGRVAMSNMFGVVYNSRLFIARLMGVPEEEILALHKALRDQAETLKGTWRLINIIGHRPMTEPVAVPVIPESPTTEMVQVAASVNPTTPPDAPVIPVAVPAVEEAAVPLPVSTETVQAPTESEVVPAEAMPDLSNLYLLGDAKADRDRLVAQTFLFSEYVRQNAQRLIHNDVKSILDIGCGHGQLTLVLSKVYPKAKIIGIDIDPLAIEIAKENQSKTPLVSGNIEFIVGDIREQLPAGPFDLVYASLITLHLMEPEKVLKMAFDVLTPGGSIWIKEGDINGGVDHPNWSKLLEMARTTMAKMGRDMYIGLRLEGMLQAIGFTDIEVNKEVYKVTNDTWQGRIALSVMLAGMHNSHRMISKMLELPEAQLLGMIKEVSDKTETLNGRWPFLNVIARRPKTSATQPAASQAVVETPVSTMGASSVSAVPVDAVPADSIPEPTVPAPTAPTDTPSEPLPDVSNLYLYGNADADRDRLVAQTFLFSEFVRENAQRLIRNDVKTILDIGCGHGQLTLVLSKVYPKARIVGVDIDPGAIEIAKENQRKMPLAPGNVEFIVGDIQDKLPDGPFDLIYASMVMMHMLHPTKVLDLAYQVLRPGGSIWIKEAHPDVVLNHPHWSKMVEMVRLTMLEIKRDLFISSRLEDMLTNAGYVNITFRTEVYRANNDQWRERVATSALLAAMYNTRKLVSKIQNIPEEQFLTMHKEITDSAETLKGHWTLVNFIAQRPKKPAKPATDQEVVESPAPPTSTPPASTT